MAEALPRWIDLIDPTPEDWQAPQIRDRISALRHDLLGVRRTLTPTRDAVHKIGRGA